MGHNVNQNAEGVIPDAESGAHVLECAYPCRCVLRGGAGSALVVSPVVTAAQVAFALGRPPWTAEAIAGFVSLIVAADCGRRV